MTNVIIYLIASIGTGVQIYNAMTRNLWWSPNDPLPTIAMIGVAIMTLGTAWSAVKGSSAAWMVFIGSLFCWAFYIPGLGTLLAGMGQSITEGRFSYVSAGAYLPLLPAALLIVATVTALMNGPLGKHEG